MERIKINLPETFAFSTTLTIRLSDLNYGGHVGNDNFLTLIQEARQLFLKSIGCAELDFFGHGLIMCDAAIEYKKELNHAQTIRIYIQVGSINKIGFDLLYKICLVENDIEILAAKAKTGMMCYDYTNKKKAHMPEEFARKINL